MMLTRQKIRIILLGLIFMFSLGVGIVIFTHQGLEEKEDILEDIVIEADAALNRFVYTQIEDGQLKWDLEAEQGTHDAKRNITNLIDIDAEFFGETPNESVTMTADTAEAHLDEETIEARGNVIVTTASGYRLRTQVLEYSKRPRNAGDNQENSEAGGVIYTAEPVAFEADKIRIQGVGMTYQLESRFLQIHSNVSARIFPDTKSDNAASTGAMQN
ncbi:MAG: LPS export ABC transporter periplasmic protein LptC [Desulfuromonadaceae bacterium]|nr:LPS export ABC transporter periplasmic protein LptC [Desulfuromonadaceae bacterium]